jgi:hypothetical protein
LQNEPFFYVDTKQDGKVFYHINGVTGSNSFAGCCFCFYFYKKRAVGTAMMDKITYLKNNNTCIYKYGG